MIYCNCYVLIVYMLLYLWIDLCDKSFLFWNGILSLKRFIVKIIFAYENIYFQMVGTSLGFSKLSVYMHVFWYRKIKVAEEKSDGMWKLLRLIIGSYIIVNFWRQSVRGPLMKGVRFGSPQVVLEPWKILQHWCNEISRLGKYCIVIWLQYNMATSTFRTLFIFRAPWSIVG